VAISNSLRKTVNRITRSSLRNVPLPLWEKLFPKDVISLCYHMVSDENLPHFQLYPSKSPAQFEADVEFCKDRTISYEDLLAKRRLGTSIPSNRFLFTFDDGFAQCFDVIRPILKRHGVDGVFFITTNFIDDRELFRECLVSLCLTRAGQMSDGQAVSAYERINAVLLLGLSAERRASAGLFDAFVLRDPNLPTPKRALMAAILRIDFASKTAIELLCDLLQIDRNRGARDYAMFMTRQQIKTLSDEGFTIGAHGLDHQLLEYLTEQEIEAEMVASCEAIRDITGKRSMPFAFPHSGINVRRSVLENILRRNPSIELIFDSGYLRRDRDFVVNRVFTDEPGEKRSTNVPATLSASWTSPSAWYRS
jgi:peptidoglycan/xylan/chitin deacetylase (PgdA/CDA1 family)